MDDITRLLKVLKEWSSKKLTDHNLLLQQTIDVTDTLVMYSLR